MAITVETSNGRTSTPREFLAWCESHVDPLDEASILSASGELYALHNNRDFVADALVEELRNIGSRDLVRQVSAQSIVFGKRSNFSVRVNIWSPLDTKDPRSREHQDQIYSYGTPHDHNFGLLTIGYEGEGYSTEIHEYDHREVAGIPGERVAMDYLETTTLSRGKIMYYRPSRDVHAQIHPRQVSLSLNLIVEHERLREKPQYEFDTGNQRIVGLLPGTAVFRHTAILDFIRAFSGIDDELAALAGDLACHGPSQYVRMAAYNTLAHHRPDETASMIARNMQREPNPIVREEMRRILRHEATMFPSLSR